ncbi:lipid-A-disaccharide synthase N-terminal domain-containing protein [Labilibaculum sp. DW002]|uniref:Lipid-A-disaccharide synthase N-terminal domain-containing protein n=1 Tax=Paralabilibaculum antarcticum TaxID=2912572 RepID=A0ABT5VZ38_9BACT|nr:lipid-A-disaccharide synthase N-terminal domain-containing protein [Labilibaculum sp. DW002]MDE5419818.1 lipid-A-disaccharide synthase N-terminal domain-containing protein [Labilibaculum sp. DW002]
MENYYIYIIGFLAQALFSARLIAQWIKSEKAGDSLSPAIFWQLSILASWLLFIYGLLRNDFAIIIGQIIAYTIYIRNLQLQNQWSKLPLITRIIALSTPIIAFISILRNWDVHYQQFFHNENVPLPLLIWGVAGQVTFTFRFIYQWIYSERKGESCLPLGFWIISIVGSCMILSYAIYRTDPVLFIGQGFGVLVYARNIVLIRKKRLQLNTEN